MLKTLRFSEDIEASKEKVWEALWEDDNYRQWTSVFSEGSHAVSEWKEGSSILFLGPNGDGMYSRIAKLEPNNYLSFEHLGTVKDGKKQPENDETKSWAGSKENYTLLESDKGTLLKVDIGVTEDYEDFFKETFPKALQKIKEIAET